MTDQVNEALEAIKTQVTEKFETVAQKESVDLLSETKADKESVQELKGALEALEAKFDNIPAPVAVQPITTEELKMLTIHEQFTKNEEESGKAFAEINVKAITEGRDVTGGSTMTAGLIGSMFAGNPVRQLASVIEVNSKAIDLPVRAGTHGAANAGSTKAVADAGNGSVGVTSLVVQTYNARSDVTIEAASDIPGFDAFWSADMMSEIGSIEAAAHVAIVEGITANTVAASATALALDDFAAVIFAVAPQYRANGSLMVSSGAMAQMRTLSTASTGGDLLWDASIGGFRLFGMPVLENAYMDAVAANGVVAAFGDFKKGLVIANRATASVGRYSETVPGKYVYYGELRSGCSVWDQAAVRKLVMAAA